MSKYYKAEDVIKAIERIKAEVSDDNKPKPMPITICNWLLVDIKNIPSADVIERKALNEFMERYADLKIKTERLSQERMRGEWLHYGGDIWACSACGESLMCDDIECNNYCPNCGAKMKG